MSNDAEQRERKSGLRAILSLAPAYEAFQRAVGARGFRDTIVSEYLGVRVGQSVLDIGCGPGSLLDALPDVDYVGFDPSEAYVQSARERYDGRGRFHHGGVDDFDPAGLGAPFDLVVAQGVLHHVDDRTAERLFSLARACVRQDGRVVTIDPALSPSQSWLAAAVIHRDRGRHVRQTHDYAELARPHFPKVLSWERHDLLRIPYTHAIVRCTV